jgi:hypothetical protein
MRDKTTLWDAIRLFGLGALFVVMVWGTYQDGQRDNRCRALEKSQNEENSGRGFMDSTRFGAPR